MDVPTQLNAALVGRYEIEREIGRGGMATVYLARDLRHDRRVALKVLSPELGALLGVERFLSEIRVTANLQHPNLLPLFDSGESDGLLFYVMPYVEGESLRRRIDREKQLPVDEALRIAIAVSSALDYAHRHEVVHRDLKPENILLQDGQPVVADFGIALAVTAAGGARITQTGLSLGTPQYMSPEQATGDRMVDGRSDIYSLAALTYEMLAGEPPHLGNTVQAIIAKVLTERPPSVRVRRPTVSAMVGAALDRSLEKLPADRFATAHDFAEALQGRGGTLTTRTGDLLAATPRDGVASGPRWRSAAWPVLALLACAAAIAAGVGWLRAARAAQSDAPVAFVVALGAGEHPYTAVGGSSVAISPDGKTIAYLSAVGNTDRRLYIRRLRELRPRPVAGSEFATQPFFSPDGAWLGFVVGNQIRKVTLDGGTAIVVGDLGGRVDGLSWGRKGDIVASANGTLVIVPERGGASRPAVANDTVKSAARRWPHWLPDGDKILYSVWRGTLAASQIEVLSLKTGKTNEVGVAGTAPLGIIDGRLIYTGPSGSLMAAEFDARRLRVVGNPAPVVDEIAFAGSRGGGSNASLADVDGSLVYVRGSLSVEPVVADSASSRPLGAPAATYSLPRYSPDGKRIAITVETATTTDIWLIDVATRAQIKMTTEGTLNERAEWSADSKRVIFRSNRSGKSDVWSQPIDGSAPAERVFGDPTLDIWEALLTADGRTLIYRTGTTGSADIWYRQLQGDTARKELAATKFNEWEARVSPDGHWVAYSSDESGTPQVYVRALPIGGPRTQVSIDGGGAPVWSRDGHRLTWVHGSEIHAAVVTTAGEFKVLSRQKILQGEYSFPSGHANYDIHPNGRQFLLLKMVGDADIAVIHGWRHALRAHAAASTEK